MIGFLFKSELSKQTFLISHLMVFFNIVQGLKQVCILLFILVLLIMCLLFMHSSLQINEKNHMLSYQICYNRLDTVCI
jgi:hypothetical protein